MRGSTVNHKLDHMLSSPFQTTGDIFHSVVCHCLNVMFPFCEYFLWVTFSSPHAVNFLTSWTGWVWLLRTSWKGPASLSTDLISTVTCYGLMIGMDKKHLNPCAELLSLCTFVLRVRFWSNCRWCKVSERKVLFIYFPLPFPERLANA